jgi:hypothetical protein
LKRKDAPSGTWANEEQILKKALRITKIIFIKNRSFAFVFHCMENLQIIS